jgi:hypothetical protein
MYLYDIAESGFQVTGVKTNQTFTLHGLIMLNELVAIILQI